MTRQLLVVTSLWMLMVSVGVSPLASADGGSSKLPDAPEAAPDSDLDWDVERDFVEQLQFKSNEVLKNLDDDWYQEMVDLVQNSSQLGHQATELGGFVFGTGGAILILGSLINKNRWDLPVRGFSEVGPVRNFRGVWGRGSLAVGIVLSAVGVGLFVFAQTIKPRGATLQELQQVVGNEMASQLILVHKLLQELSDAWDRKGVALQIPNNLVWENYTAQERTWRFPVRPDTRIVLGRTVDPAVAQQIEIRAGDFELLIQSSDEESTDYVKLSPQDSQQVKVFVLSKIAEKYLNHLDDVAERAAAHHLYAPEFNHPDAFLDTGLEVSFDEVLFLNDAALDGTVPAYGKITYRVHPQDLLDDDSSAILLRAAH